MEYDEIDLSDWDPRTLEIVDKYNDLRGKFKHWMRQFHGKTKLVELTYLRHIGMKIYGRSLDKRGSDSEEDQQIAIDAAIEARSVFDLFRELDTTEDSERAGYIRIFYEQIDSFLKIVSNR